MMRRRDEFNSVLEKAIFEAFDENRFDIPEETLEFVTDYVRKVLLEEVMDIMTNGYDLKHQQLNTMLGDYLWMQENNRG